MKNLLKNAWNAVVKSSTKEVVKPVSLADQASADKEAIKRVVYIPVDVLNLNELIEVINAYSNVGYKIKGINKLKTLTTPGYYRGILKAVLKVYN